MELAQTIILVLNFLAVVVGGAWVYYRTIRRREHAVKLDFIVDVDFVGSQSDSWLVSLNAHVNNEGFVRHVVRVFDFDLRYLTAEDRLDSAEHLNGQVEIPNLLLEGSWLPAAWNSTFIEPGLNTVYSFVAAVPAAATFVLLHGLLDYGDGAIHTAEKLVAVPRSADGHGVGPG